MDNGDRLVEIADAGSFVADRDVLRSRDPLGYPRYEELLEKARAASGADESVSAGEATVGGVPVQLAVFAFDFLGGSMGEVAGERIARGLERAAARGVPFVLQTATGGARMHEGMRSLIQMPKVIAARRTLAESHQPLIAVLGHPTTGGVLASVGAMADVTIARAGATIGFAGPRLVGAFTGRRLQPGSHTADSAFRSGLVDAVVDEADLAPSVARALQVLRDEQPEPTPEWSPRTEPRETTDGWAAVQAARAPERPTGRALLKALTEEQIELHGDRAGADDPALACAIARIHGRRAVVLALDRDHAPGPSAYRKARRCIDIAARIGIPVVTLVDTPGADPSEASEAGGIAFAIADLFDAMLAAPVPLLALVTGQGGSGGALAFATADRLLAWHDSIFSVIAPEAAADILWKDRSRADEAASRLKLSAAELLRLGIADGLVDEPLDGDALMRVVASELTRFDSVGSRDWPATRRARWRSAW